MRARCLGASAVLFGRPLLSGLAVSGRTGVTGVLRLLKEDLERTLGLVGAATLEELTSEFLLKPLTGP